jgi:hypothetical protein
VTVVVLGVVVVVVRSGMTTPDLGKVISPIGLIIVGPIGTPRGTKTIPAIPAAMSASEPTVHQTSDR